MSRLKDSSLICNVTKIQLLNDVNALLKPALKYPVLFVCLFSFMVFSFVFVFGLFVCKKLKILCSAEHTIVFKFHQHVIQMLHNIMCGETSNVSI